MSDQATETKRTRGAKVPRSEKLVKMRDQAEAELQRKRHRRHVLEQRVDEMKRDEREDEKEHDRLRTATGWKPPPGEPAD